VSGTENIYRTDTREGDALTPRYVFIEEENLLGERRCAMGEFYDSTLNYINMPAENSYQA